MACCYCRCGCSGWRATASGSDAGTIGFHLSALYSPVGWFSWADIARMWEAAQATDEARAAQQARVPVELHELDAAE
jgi:hypothetical protein